jgi:hypothetical protein
VVKYILGTTALVAFFLTCTFGEVSADKIMIWQNDLTKGGDHAGGIKVSAAVMKGVMDQCLR